MILLPLILIKIPSNDMGIWYLFISLTAGLSLLDFGFGSSISRSISYIYSGSKSLPKEGISEEHSDETVDYNLLKSVIFVIRRIYGVVTLIIVTSLVIIGSFYLKSVIPPDSPHLWLAWYIYSISVCMNFFYSYYDSLLIGRGMIQEANMAIISAKIVYLTVAATGVLMGFGLLSIAVASVLSTFTNRYLFYIKYYDAETKLNLHNAVIRDTKNILNNLWFNSKKFGLVSLGVFLTFQSNILIAGKYFTLPQVASLGLTTQFFGILQTFSRLHFNTSIPRFSSLRVKKDLEVLKHEFLYSMKIGWMSYVFGFLVLLFAGQVVLSMLHSKTSLPGSTVLILFGLVYLMEVTQGNCVMFLATKNTVPFVPSSLIAGIAIVSLNILFVSQFKMGLEAFALSTVIVQLCYNAWKWPYEVIKDLNIDFSVNTWHPRTWVKKY
jgi:O-antigen/teichoic acid export membrane protein